MNEPLSLLLSFMWWGHLHFNVIVPSSALFIKNFVFLSDTTPLLGTFYHLSFKVKKRLGWLMYFIDTATSSSSFVPLSSFLDGHFVCSTIQEPKNPIFDVPSVRKVVAARMSTNLSVKKLPRQFFAPWTLDYRVFLTSDVQTSNFDSFVAKSGKPVFVFLRDESRHEDAKVKSERKFSVVLKKTEESTKSGSLWETEKTVVSVFCPGSVHSSDAFV